MTYKNPGFAFIATWLVVIAVLRLDAQDAKAQKLFLISNRDKGKFNVFVMKPDGSEQKNISNSEVDECDPALSPDEKKIAFTVGAAGKPEVANANVFVMNADGKDRKQLTKA